MRTRTTTTLILLSSLVILSLACSSVSGLVATPTPQPTSTFTPTPPPTQTPTPEGPRAANGETIVASIGNLKLSNELYTHPNGFVSFYPMEGWEITSDDYYVNMAEPNGNVVYTFTAINTGYELDSAAFEQFRINGELLYTYQEQYNEINSGSNPAINLYFIEKSYILEGIEFYVNTIYQQIGNVIYITEVYGDINVINPDPTNFYWVMFNSFTQTININSKIASGFPMYEWTWSYTADDVPASLNVPWHWSYDTDTTQNIAYFAAPDNKAGVNMLSIPTVKLVGDIGKNFAFDLSLTYLENTTNASDFVTSEVENFTAGEGTYIYSWSSETIDISGITLLDTRVANKLILIVIYSQNDVYDTYTDILIPMGDSYFLEQ
ncbi:MAG: hypothetical protein H6635_09950 [Anaerolineales bacterium]|nr:hypothetical protein [Anaerolineales bacterium]MCB9145682.1 hypothetical protein [Anaerolineales bacterium]